MSLHPREGARYLFEFADSSGDSATYAVTIYTPDAETKYTARLGMDGTADASPVAEALSEALEATLRAIAKTISRTAAKSDKSGLPPWPRRVLRWRGPGRGR